MCVCVCTQHSAIVPGMWRCSSTPAATRRRPFTSTENMWLPSSRWLTYALTSRVSPSTCLFIYWSLTNSKYYYILQKMHLACLVIKLFCEGNRAVAEKTMWNLCVRWGGPKVRVNGSLWSLSNLIQGEELSPSVVTEGDNLLLTSPRLFFFPISSPFLSFLSPPFLWFLSSLSFSPVLVSLLPWSPFLSSQQMVWYPLSHFFFLASIELTFVYMWPHTRMNTLSLPISMSLHLFPSLFPSLASFSLSVRLSSDREEGSRSLSDEGMQAGWIWRVSHLLSLNSLSSVILKWLPASFPKKIMISSNKYSFLMKMTHKMVFIIMMIDFCVIV